MSPKAKHHITVEPYTLEQALELAAKVTGKTRPAENHWTGSVLLEATGKVLTVSATDLNVCAQVQLDVAGTIRAVVPAGALLSMVKVLPDGMPATLEHDGTTVTLSSGTKRRFTLPLHAQTDDDLAWYVGPGDAEGYTITREALARIAKVAPSAGQDSNRPLLTGVLLADGHAFATDSYRAAAIPMPGLEGLPTVVIPEALLAKALASLKDDVTIAANPRRLELRAWNGRLSCTTLEGEHPMANGALRARLGVDGEPVGPVHEFPKAELLDALKALAVAANDERTVRVDAEPGAMVARLSASNQLRATGAEVEVPYTGPGLVCGFNAGYLADAAEPCDDTVVIRETSEHDPGTCPTKPSRIDAGDLRQLLMPVQVR